MKARNTILLWALASLSVACSETEDSLISESSAPLTISTEIVTTRAYFDTGLKNDVEFKDGNQIGVSLTSNYGFDWLVTNKRATLNGYKWSFDTETKLSNEKYKVTAYYPYSTTYLISTITINKSRAVPPILHIINPHNVPIDISSYAHGDGQQDYLWGEAVDSVSITNPNARIRFKHVLPRITFNVTADGDETYYVRSAILTNSKDGDNTICANGTMNVMNGTLTKSSKGAPITNSYVGPVVLDANVSNRTFDFLVFPTEVSDGSVLFRIEVRKGSNGTFQFYDVQIPATTWEAGKQYTYPVVLNISEKEEETKKTPGEKVYMGFNGDNGKPLYWSSWNLGASKPEDYGGLYGWGDPSGDHKEQPVEYGWGHYLDGESFCLTYYGGAAAPPSTIAGTSEDVARAKWGTGWRIPSNGEIWRLKAYSSYEFVSVNGVDGVKFTSQINGNTLFFPMAPYRVGDYLMNLQTATYYWLSDINTSDRTKAETLYISPTYKVAYPTDGRKRYEGHPIRPVTEL